MSATPRKDPLRNSRFLLEIDGITQAGFSEVTIPDSSNDPIEYREGNEATTVRKIPGLSKYSNIVLKYGITDSMELWNWYKTIVDGKINTNRKNISIYILDELGNEDMRWTFVNCWPMKYTPPPLNAKGNEIAIETVEIAQEGMLRNK
jgi:phage tail-like protein